MILFIQAFQGKRMNNTFKHVKNVQTKGNGAYMTLNGHDIKDYMLENMQILDHKLYMQM